MRIQKIYLDAFGLFTDCVKDLSGGNEGLHIIYGPNEAGKSTALRAITQLFFGIPSQPQDNFLHPNNSLRIGASISDGSLSLEFNRRKGNKKTLLNRDNDDVLEDSELDTFLGGLDEVTFTTLFGLNHLGLIDGGKAIVDGQGNVGETLFAASAGLNDLRGVMQQLQDEAGELFKPSGSKPRINEAKINLDSVRKELKSALLRPGEWSDKDKELRHTIENREKIEKIIIELKTEHNCLSKILEASPLYNKYIVAVENLSLVADAVLLPEDFGEQFKTLNSEKAQASRKMTDAKDELAKTNEIMDSLTVNKAVLEQEAEIENLNKLYFTNRKALDDSQKLEPELDLLKKQTTDALELFRSGMKLQEVKSLRIKPTLRRLIIDQGQKRESIKDRHENAENALSTLVIARNSVSTSLEKIESVPEPNELERTVLRIRKLGDIEEHLLGKRKDSNAKEKEISTGISRLEMWDGSMDELENLPVPSQETIERFRGEFERLENQHKSSNDRQKETEEDQRNLDEKITALNRDHDAPTEKLLNEHRDIRNDCWQIVRREWEDSNPPGEFNSADVYDELVAMGAAEDSMGNLADAYESVTRETDEVSDRLRLEADRVATLAQLEAGKISLTNKTEGLLVEFSGIENEFKKCSDSWDELWGKLNIKPRAPKEMAVWAQIQRELVKNISEYRSSTVDIELLLSNIEKYSTELGAALTLLGESPRQDGESLTALIERAEDKVLSSNRIIGERKHLIEKLESIDTIEMPEAENEFAHSKELLATWEVEWAVTMDGLGENKDTTPGEANTIVQQIDELTTLHDKIDEREKRIDQISEDDIYFRQKVKDLAKVVAIDCGDLSEENISQKLYSELKQSGKNKSKLDTLSNQAVTAEKHLGESKTEMTRINETLSGLCVDAHVSSNDELPSALDRSKKRRAHENEIKDIEARLTELSPGKSLSEFIEMVNSADINALEPTLSQLVEKINDQEDELKTVSEKIGGLVKELDQMDGSADAARLEEDAQSLLADISVDVEQYARLKISELVLARAIEQYRDKNQGPLLSRAGEIFSKLTLGSFEGLTTDFGNKDEDILVGVRSDGKESVRVDGMSDGTADQLYLALRLASLEQYFKTHPPIPFILDDILVNFDDDRSVATLKILAELSQRTQVIFFTHHSHIVEIAKQNIEKKVLFTHNL
ncbi:AAA family ATPase [Candidatus Latescibacterota bacterium]